MINRRVVAWRARAIKRNLLACGCKLSYANHITRQFIAGRMATK